MFQDLRFALRTLRQSPAFAAVAIISLAFGIGVNAAIFSLANALILRPLPVPNASALIAVQSHLRGESIGGMIEYSSLSYPDYVDLRDKSKSFESLAASQFSPFGVAPEKTVLPQMKFGQLVSGNFFRVMQVQPVLGRGFRLDEDRVTGRDAVVVLGHDLWKTEFASNPDVVGRTIFLNGIAFTVIGVTPESFSGSQLMLRSSLYVPAAMGPRLAGDSQQKMLDNRGEREWSVQGRLKPGVSVAQAAAEASVVARQLAQTYPDTNRTCSLVVDTDVLARLKRSPYDFMLVAFLMAMAGVVLLIGCANVMNLMLSRARARSREIAVRLAIGAGRTRLVRQLMTESLLIALLGGALGLLIALTGADLFSQIRIPSDLPIVIEATVATRELLFSILVSVASAVLFGLAPALQSSRPDLVLALKSGRADSGKRRPLFGRNTLVVAQVAGALLVLVFATQAYRGAASLLSSPAGFRADHLLTAGFDPMLARYTPDQTRQFYKQLLEKSRTMTGVQSAALAQTVPMIPGGALSRVVPEGVQLPPGTEAVSVASNTVSENYFAVLDVPIVQGREFQATDRSDSPRVAIVNELFARKFYSGQNAIGKRFRLNGAAGPLVEIVGVAKQSKYFSLIEPPFDFIYLPLSQNPQSGLKLVLQTAGPSAVLSAPLREMVRSLDAGQPMFGVRTMEEIFDQRARKTLHILFQAIGAMGLLGLALALIGLYGLMSYSVSLRAREIGIRMAIGADRVGVMRMVLRQGMVLAGSGVLIGLLLCWMTSRAVSVALGVPSLDWTLLALVATGLVSVAALGAYVPSRRASLVDPNSVLRQE